MSFGPRTLLTPSNFEQPLSQRTCIKRGVLHSNKTMNVKHLVAFVLSLSCSYLCGQEEQEDHHHGREFGISLSYVDLIEENETAPSIHLHWLKPLKGSESLERWGIGLGFETIFADHTHHTVMATLAFPRLITWCFRFHQASSLRTRKQVGKTTMPRISNSATDSRWANMKLVRSSDMPIQTKEAIA